MLQPLFTRRAALASRSLIPSRVFSAQISTNNGPVSFFQQDQLPANTVIRFVPQQTAWVVERMGKFHRYVLKYFFHTSGTFQLTLLTESLNQVLRFYSQFLIKFNMSNH